MTDVLFLDKDDTLGEFDGASSVGLYPNVEQFLQDQKKQGRKLYIATTASVLGREHLKQIDYLLDGYFGNELICSGNNVFYCAPDGRIGNVREDFKERRHFLPPDERENLEKQLNSLLLTRGRTSAGKIGALLEKLHTPVHKDTQQPYDPSTKYSNPNFDKCTGFMKDLYLAKKRISVEGYANLRTLMIGDNGDRYVPSSDPETPLVIISNDVRAGMWDIVKAIVDGLFSNPELMPWQTYDQLFSQAEKRAGKGLVELKNETRTLKLLGQEFVLEKRQDNSRLVFC